MEPAPAGNHADIAATLLTAGDRVFLKAARRTAPDADGPEVRSLRWEAAINPHVTEYAPRLHWTAEAGGWLALGFEYVRARHADYTPGSPDLEILAEVIDTFQALPCPKVLTAKRAEIRWQAVTDDVTPLAGDALLHCDLNPANVLISREGTVRVVDWAFVARGAAFLEPALLVPWLLKAGHHPTEAEAWAGRFSSWSDADPAHIDLFCRSFADKWQLNIAANGEAAWALEHAAAARRWADYRLG
jgi:hypothetical protein